MGRSPKFPRKVHVAVIAHPLTLGFDVTLKHTSTQCHTATGHYQNSLVSTALLDARSQPAQSAVFIHAVVTTNDTCH